MRRALLVLGLLALVAVLLTRGEVFAPTVSLETPVDAIGRATPLRVLAGDRGTGLAVVEVRLAPSQGSPAVVLVQDYPRTSWLGSGIRSALLSGTVDAVHCFIGLAISPATCPARSAERFFTGAISGRHGNMSFTG